MQINTDKEIRDAFVPEESKGLTYLEQLTARSNVCQNSAVPFVALIDPTTKKIQYIRAACKLWSCPQCSISNAKKWIARIIDGCNNLPCEKWHFATITTPGDWRGSASLYNIRKNWHKLRKRLARKTLFQDENLHYTRVWEHHLDASFHMHLITNAQVGNKWVKDNARESGLGYIAKIEGDINPGQAAGYVAKYMLKQASFDLLHTYPKGVRRIEASRNWVPWQKYAGDEIFVYVGDVIAAQASAKFRKEMGWKVFDLAIKNEVKKQEKQYKDITNDK